VDTAGGTRQTWWQEPVARFIDYIGQERDLVILSRFSIEALKSQDAYSPAMEVAAAAVSKTGPELVAHAQAESSQDHPVLHGHSLVGIWGALETMVIDVVIAWLQHRPQAMTRDIADMKVPFSAFESLSREERIDNVAHELDRVRGTGRGIDRFENLLDAIQLSGSHEKVLARNIYEMQQIRNVFAHKRGIADRHFIDACPYLGYNVGDRVLIGRDAWIDFTVTAVTYAEVILRRMRQQLGMSIDANPIVLKEIRHGK
jgi:hypothetical protein